MSSFEGGRGFLEENSPPLPGQHDESDKFFSEMGPIRNAKKQYLKYYGIY